MQNRNRELGDKSSVEFTVRQTSLTPGTPPAQTPVQPPVQTPTTVPPRPITGYPTDAQPVTGYPTVPQPTTGYPMGMQPSMGYPGYQPTTGYPMGMQPSMGYPGYQPAAGYPMQQQPSQTGDYVDERDMEYMKRVCPEVCRRVQPFVEEVIDTMDYEGSPMYEDYMSREAVEQMIDRAYERVVREIPELGEEDDNVAARQLYGRNRLVRALLGSLLLTEVFGRRRPRYRRRRYDPSVTYPYGYQYPYQYYY